MEAHDRESPAYTPDPEGYVAVEPRCTARSSTGTGTRCRNRPMLGTTVCRKHGGSAPQVRAKAARTVTQQRAMRDIVREFGEPTTDVDPVDKLLLALWLASAMTDGLRRALAEEGNPEESVRLLSLLGEWADKMARYAKMAADAGVHERQVAIAEAQGIMLIGIITGAFSDAGISMPDVLRTALQRRLLDAAALPAPIQEDE